MSTVSSRDDRSQRALITAITNIWTDILGADQQTELDQNFFDAGGDSLRLLRLQNALNERFGVSLGGVELFEHTTIRQLATFLEPQLR